MADDGRFDWSATDGFSIEYWMRSSSDCAGNEVIVGRQGPTHPKPHWWTGCLDSGDQAAFNLYDNNGGNGGNTTWAYSGTDITDGLWHHIVAVKDATHIRIYVDGAEKDAVAKNYTSGFGTVTPLNIGYLNLDAHYRYEGDLDEVAIYNRALTPAEIQQHYVNGLGGIGSCDVGPRFTSLDLETSVDTAADRAGWEGVAGTLATGFSLGLAPAVPYHYLDVSNDPGETVVDRPLADGLYGFYLGEHPASYNAYWDALGVNA